MAAEAEEEVRVELEAVVAVCGDDCRVLRDLPPHLVVHVRPRTADDSSQQVPYLASSSPRPLILFLAGQPHNVRSLPIDACRGWRMILPDRRIHPFLRPARGICLYHVAVGLGLPPDLKGTLAVRRALVTPCIY
jgi:hypothetical protein